MSAAEKLLVRLSRVKPIGPDKWAASCPVCQSRNGRPISIRALPDGRVLMHPFCGCDTEDVLQAGGLRLSDLFPESLGDFKPERRPFDPVQVLQAISHEIMVVCLIASDMGETGNSDQEQERRLATASQRLGNALTMIGELPVPDAIKRIRRAEAAPA